jgi:hypothetical protein
MENVKFSPTRKKRSAASSEMGYVSIPFHLRCHEIVQYEINHENYCSQVWGCTGRIPNFMEKK